MTALTKTQDDRIEARTDMSGVLPACFRSEADGRVFSGLLLNLSQHGLMIRTDHALADGELVEMLTLAGKVELEARWSEEHGPTALCGLRSSSDLFPHLSLLH